MRMMTTGAMRNRSTAPASAATATAPGPVRWPSWPISWDWGGAIAGFVGGWLGSPSAAPHTAAPDPPIEIATSAARRANPTEIARSVAGLSHPPTEVSSSAAGLEDALEADDPVVADEADQRQHQEH